MKILKPNSPFIPTGIDKEDFIHFPFVAWENVWKSKNAARTQNIVEHWDDIFRRINGSARAYSYASFNRKKILRVKFNDKWEPPPAGWLKITVDAAVRGSKFWSAAVQRDNYGKINGAWVNFDVFVSVFMLNYVLPFLFFRQEMVSNLKTLFWRVMLLELLTPLLETKPIQIGDPHPLVDFGISMFVKWPCWSVEFVPRACNSVVHNLSKWVASNSFSGYLPLSLVPDSVVLQDEGTFSVIRTLLLS